MKIRELLESKTTSKPRNFVAKNAQKTTSGAGAHKDKKRAEKQGDVKHKKQAVPMEGVAESKPGWMLKQDPKLAAKVKAKTDLAKKRQASYGDPGAGKSADKKGVAEGSINTYILNVMDEATGEHWAIEVQATSPETAKERAQQQGFKVLRIKEKGMAEGSLNEFAPDGFDSGDGDEFSPEIAKMAQDDGFTKGASLADGATLERAMSINHWHNQHGGMYKQYFAKGFKAGRLEKIRHDNKQYNLNLKLMKDGSIRRGGQGVAESKIQYGVLDHANVNLIIDKSESKPDGVYSFRGILFRVKGGKVTHWATDGKILQAMGRFNTQIGSYSTDAKAKALLKSIKEGVAEGSEEQVYKVVALDKSNALKKPTKLNVKASSIEDVFSRLAANDWYALSINGVEVVAGKRLKQGVAEGSHPSDDWETISDIESKTGKVLGLVLQHLNGTYGFYDVRKSNIESGFSSPQAARQAFVDLHNARRGVAEVSKDTLDRYVTKAVDAHGHADFAARMSKDDPNLRSYHKDQKRTAEKRQQGISRALDRMSKNEDVSEARIDEKAKSKAQQKFMGMVYAAKKGEKPASPEVAKVAKGMSKKSAKDYAQTKHKGKPEHVKETATAGATSAANVSVGAVYKNKRPKIQKPGTNALDMKGGNLMTGGSIKR
jgi:hypothetical protein